MAASPKVLARHYMKKQLTMIMGNYYQLPIWIIACRARIIFQAMKVENLVTACTHNDLGVKGCGEAGAIASPPAVINAVVDALSPLGVTDITMPATPQKVWQAIQSAQTKAAE